MHNKKIFIVVGAHRSGTSIVTNCIHSLGLNLSPSLVPSSVDNPDGFFEDAAIVEFNTKIEQVLDRGHMDVSSILPFPDNWLSLPEIKAMTGKLEAYLSTVVENESPLLIKDPRICRLLPLYFDVLAKLEIMPVCFFVHRSPASVIRSKAERDILGAGVVETHWQISNMSALEAIFERHISVCFVGYESLLRNANTEINRISHFLGKFLNLDKKPGPMPEIRNADLERKLKLDSSKISLNPFSVRLEKYLDQADDLTKKGYRRSTEFNALSDEFNRIINSAAPWIEFAESNSSFANTKNEDARKIERLESALQKANGKFFSMNKKFEESKIRLEKVELSLAESNINYEQLTVDYDDLNRDHQLLLLRQRTKIFLIADKLQSLKERIIGKRLLAHVEYTKRSLGLIKKELVSTRRYLNSNGVRKTAIKIGHTIAGKFTGLSATKKLKLAQSLHENDKSQGRVLLAKSSLQLSTDQIELLLDLFLKEYYSEVAGLANSISYCEALTHFIDIGIENGLSPSPLFSPSAYLRDASLADLNVEGAFLHWLSEGVEKKIVPTALFDEDFFVARHAISKREDEWPFRRFISVSVYNDATPNQFFEPNWYRQKHDIADSNLPIFYHYLLIGSKKAWRPSPSFPSFSRAHCLASKLSPMEQVMDSSDFRAIRTRLKCSPLLMDLVNKAAAIEPAVLLPEGDRRLNIQPYTNPFYPAMKDLRRSLGKSQYDTIVLIPHCRYGGSGLVAGELCHSLLRVKPEEHVLLIRTDNDDFMRPDWYPEDIDNLNLLDFGCDLPDAQRIKLLLDLLVGLKPKRIINVHSRLGWEVLKVYGDRLKRWSSLYGYTFCYDVSALGAKVGYPVKYVPETIANLDGLLVDNTYLKNDLIKVNKWDQETINRVSVLRTPHQGLPESNSGKKKKLNQNSEVQSRRKIFWAGRFDRQKRFDLVLKLAGNNPSWDFHVWGAPMLGDEESVKNVPENITMHGLFNSYSEIPFEDCDVWLYTSQWDGVPTILIELGLRGVPLVASRIWGTADLINEDTAYPVDQVTDVSFYENGIKEVLNNPEEAVKRAQALKSLVISEYCRPKYDADLKQLIKDDEWRPN